MSDKIQIQITATDGASRVFQQVASGAERLDRSLDQVGDGFQDLSQDAAASTTSLQEWENVGRDIGLSLGVLATGMALAGRSFRDQEVALRTLERGYGDAAAEMEAFAEQIQDTTNFSNDAAIAAANTFRTLSDNYGFTADQIQQLISISADLAATMGIGLSDAAFRVQSAMRGEAEAAEFLGLTLNDRALGLDRVSTSMTEAERAQIRFNALQEQSAFALGTAAEQADTTYGSMTQLRDSVQDAAQAFGDFLGPVGEIGAFAAENAVQLGLMSIALTQLGTTANSISKALTGVGLASNAMSLAMGPAGIVAAAGLAAVGIGALANYLSDDYNSAVDEASTATQTFTDNLIALGQSGTLSMLNQAIAQRGLIISQYGKDLAAADEDTHNFIESMTQIQTVIGDPGGAINARTKEVTDALTEAQIAFIDGIQLVNGAIVQGNEDGILSFEELQLAIENTDQVMANTGETAQEYAAAWDSAQSDIASIMSDTTEAGIEAQQRLLQVFKNVGDGMQTMEGAAKTIDQIEKDMQAATAATIANGEAINENTDSVIKWLDAAGEVQTLSDDIAKSMHTIGQASVELGDTLVRSTDPFVLRQSEILAGMQEQMLLMGQMSTWDVNWAEGPSSQEVLDFDQAIAQTKATANAAQSAQEGLARGIESAANAMTYQVGESARLEAELAKQEAAVQKLRDQYAQTFEQMQADATRASDTLDTVFGAIVGNTDAIAKQSQDVADWAAGIAVATEHMDEWGNSLGWWSVADNLLYEARISQEDYNAAVDANTQIQAANAEIQQDVLSIQTQLAPVIATATEALAAQMDEIANGSTDAQLFALGMMDAATSSQALALAQGYLENQDVFGPMIQQAAELNPMLAQILEEMGLISYNPATGEVRLLGADEAISDLDRLTEAIDRLTMVQWMIMLDADATEAEAAFEAATGQAVDWDNQEPEAQLLVDTSQALSGLSDVDIQLDNWDADSGTASGDLDIGSALAGFDTVTGALGSWDASSGSADVYVNDYASGTLQSIAGLLAGLQDRTVTVTTVYQALGSFFAHGGVVSNYDTGGVVAEMAEYGPELLHFPNGGVALARTRGIYTVPQGTYVDTAPATAYKLGSNINFAININGPSSWDDAAEQVSRKIIPAISRAMREHERSLGGY